jgi:hypothetical protein
MLPRGYGVVDCQGTVEEYEGGNHWRVRCLEIRELSSSMKNILLSCLVVVAIPVWADDATTNAASAMDTNAAPAAAAAAPAPPPAPAAPVNTMPGPSTNAASLAPVKGDPGSLPSTDERMEVMDINLQLRAMLHGGDSSPEAWDAADARIVGLQKKYGKSDETTGNIVLLRKIQLAVAKKGGVDGRYDALVTKLAADPIPQVAALGAAAASAPKPTAPAAPQ